MNKKDTGRHGDRDLSDKKIGSCRQGDRDLSVL